MSTFSTSISVTLVDETSGAVPTSGSVSAPTCYLSIDGGSLSGTTVVALSSSTYLGTFGSNVAPMMAGMRKLVVQCVSGSTYYGPIYSSSFVVSDSSLPFSALVTGSTSLVAGTSYSFSVQLYNKYEIPHAQVALVSMNLYGNKDAKFDGIVNVSTDIEGFASFTLAVNGPAGSYYIYPVVSEYSLLAKALAVTVTAPSVPSTLGISAVNTVGIGSPFSITVYTYIGNSYLFTTVRTISLSLSGGTFASGVTTSAATSSGSVTFSSLIINPSSSAGTFTLTASDLGGASKSVSFEGVFSSTVLIQMPSEPYFLKTVGSFSYSVKLSSKPLASVTVSIASGTTSLITVSSASLVFSTTNWATAQTVTLTVIPAGLVTGKTDVMISHSTTSSDTTYSSGRVLFYGCDRVFSSGDLKVTVLDSGVPGSLSLTGSFFVVEGSSSTFSIKLTQMITSNVQVSLSNNDGLVFTPNSLVFTSSDYSSSQLVTVSASHGLTSGESSLLTKVSYSVTSTSANYANSIASSNAYVIVNSKSASAGLYQSEFPVLNDGGSGSYTIKLMTFPSSAVTVTLTSSSSDLTIDNTPLTLSSTWSRSVSLSHTPSTYPTSLIRSYTINHQMSSSDADYDGNSKFSISKDLTVYVLITCTYGEYYSSSSFTCVNCPVDYRCPSPINIEQCKPGEYSPDGIFECLPCPPGFECNPGTSGKVACGSGFYSIASSSSCLECPAGSYCSVPNAKPSDCPLGTYSPSGAVSCTQLGPGEVGFPWVSPSTCPSGYIPSAYKTHCEKCPAGHYCSDPAARLITPCPNGEYSQPGSSSCNACTASKACSRSETLGTCPEGFYSDLGVSSCVICPVGSFCTGGLKFACPGSFEVGLKTCSNQACPAQHYCRQGLPPMPCPPGYVSNVGDMTCTACDPGTYQSGNNCLDCPAGFFCASPVSPPIACYFGTYSTSRSISCTICDPGFTCSQGSANPSQLNCPGGYDCTQSITAMTGVEVRWPEPCIPGTYNPGTTSSCSPCPSGYFCPGAVRDYQKFRCPPGHYCTAGVAAPIACSAGTYNPLSEAAGVGQCLGCSDGYYSLAGAPYCFVCPPGFYCNGGNKIACPSGKYFFGVRGKASTDCESCPPGFYCDSGTSSGTIVPTSCPPFTYNSDGAGASATSCLSCPGGKWCPLPRNSHEGRLFECPVGSYCLDTGVITECLPGTESSTLGGSSSAVCLACTEGYYCPASGTGSSNPKIPCSEGSYCPSGSSSPTACPAGTFSDKEYLTQASECTTCPAGYYCPGGMTYPVICPPGKYCTRGATSGTDCPAGTYNPFRGLTDSKFCKKCPKGNYCVVGSELPTTCPGGYYSSSLGATACSGCPVGHRCPGTGLRKAFPCGKGYYSSCCYNSNFCSVCPFGRYCPLETTSNTLAGNTYRCPAGLYCPAQMDHFPTNLRDRCPVGSYCPYAQTGSLQTCPDGTLRRVQGAASIAECISVEAGYYVSTTGASQPTGECSAGHYCTGGSNNPTQYQCPDGTYRLITGGTSISDCGSCPSGYYCGVGASTPTACPSGSYCAEGDSQAPRDCPEGTYNPATAMNRLSDCITCPKGFYCSGTGRTSKSGTCYGGYLCLGGAVNPYGGTTSGAVVYCPNSGYCPGGTPRTIPCPPGKYMTTTGSSNTGNCADCPGGKYCAGATNTYSGLCEAGFYCTGGATMSRQYIADPGYYTDSGASSQTACPAGTFNPAKGQSTCLSCPAGMFCSGTGNIRGTICGQGQYCPLGSSSGINCPAGTYNPFTGMKALTDCINCPPGFACQTTGMTSVSISCNAGYWCLSSASSASPGTTVNEKYGPCPPGFYCVSGSSAPRPCGPGTYNPNTYGSSASSCQSCSAGFYCEGFGNSAVSGPCEAGFYCPQGQKVKRPFSYICPEGSYCPTGSSSPSQCESGKFQANKGQSLCMDCPAGFYCPAGTSDYSSNICPEGYYCPAGTTSSTQFPCQPGTYNPIKGATSASFCIPCDPGKYCSGLGQSSVSGTCDGGYICTGSSTTPTPTGTGGQQCDPGFYCPSGGNVQIRCKAGYYCDSAGLSSPTGLCDPGYYCTGNSVVSNPLTGTGGLCPSGHYCPAGSIAPIPCKAGTFNTETGESSVSACTTCYGGSYCQGIGLSATSGNCTAGFYCPVGSVTGKQIICPLGAYCPKNLTNRYLTPNRYYQWRRGQGNALMCPQGFYCRGSAVTVPTICPVGVYCPNYSYSVTEFRCPIGTYNPLLGRTNINHCLLCPPGMYCATIALSAPTGLCAGGYYCPENSESPYNTTCSAGTYCPPGSSKEIPCPPGKYCEGTANQQPDGDCQDGYYCNEGSTTSTPTDGVEGGVCPQGYFCPAGSSVPKPCPLGTFNPYAGKFHINHCLPCTQGFYCNQVAAVQESGICKAGFFCITGSTSDSPDDGLCPLGSYCPEGSYQSIDCPAGYFGNLKGLSSCFICPKGFTCQGSTSQPVICSIGYYCPEGSILEVPCPEKTYNPFKGQSFCIDCPAGFYCSKANPSSPIIAPTICKPGFYCPTNVILPCPTGTYSEIQGLQRQDNCKPCKSGHYCSSDVTLGGVIAEECIKGFYCVSGMDSPSPAFIYSDSKVGMPCPSGYYCLKGTSTLSPCPYGKFIVSVGADEASDCSLCAEGFYCIPGDTVPYKCPPGHYCPTGSQLPTPCPLWTYSAVEGAKSAKSCQPCPKGFFCNEPGIGDYSRFPCTFGHFCPSSALEELPCPLGTWGPIHGLGNASECYPCPAGSYCKTQGRATYSHCEEWKWCAEGSSSQEDCPGGYYCHHNTRTLNPCPGGFFCPATSPAALAPPYRCEKGFYCPPGSPSPKKCPDGTVYVTKSLRILEQDSCVACPPGTYALVKQCLPCDEGFVCLKGSSTPRPQSLENDGGYPCPPGHYCPKGSTEGLPCPVGFHYREKGAVSLKDCQACPSGMYNDIEGQGGCFKCGPNADSLPGSTSCFCKGLNRSYMKRDATCRCKPGFSYYKAGTTVSDEDSSEDCVPTVIPICGAGSIRSHDGSCVSQNDCSKSCDGGKGKISPELGICTCLDSPGINDVCDQECQARTPKVKLGPDGLVEIFDPTSGKSSKVDFQSTPGFSGKPKCFTGLNCEVKTVEMKSKGSFESNFQPSLIVSGPKARSLSTSKSISNPIFCLEYGDTMVFEVTSSKGFPVYMRNSLLNTNPEFDYSPFIELQKLIEEGNQNISSFAYTFTDPGRYVFGNSEALDNVLIVTVMKSTEKCFAALRERTTQTLSRVGVYQKTQKQESDWSNFFLMVSIFGGFAVLVVLIYFFQKKSKKKTAKANIRVFRKMLARNASLVGLLNEEQGKFDPNDSRLARKSVSGTDMSEIRGRYRTELNETRMGRLENSPVKSRVRPDLDETNLAILDESFSRPGLRGRTDYLDPKVFESIYKRLADISVLLRERARMQKMQEKEYAVKIKKSLNDMKGEIHQVLNPLIHGKAALETRVENIKFTPSADPQTQKIIEKITKDPVMDEITKRHLIDDLMNSFSALEAQFAADQVKSTQVLKERLEQRARFRRDLIVKKKKLEDQERIFKEHKEKLLNETQGLFAQYEKEFDKDRRRAREKIFGNTAKNFRRDMLEKIRNDPQNEQLFIEQYEEEMRRLESNLNAERAKAHQETLLIAENRRNEKIKQTEEKTENSVKNHENVLKELEKTKNFLDLSEGLESLVQPDPPSFNFELSDLEERNIDRKFKELQRKTEIQLESKQSQLKREKQKLTSSLGVATSTSEIDKILQEMGKIDSALQAAKAHREAEQRSLLSERLKDRRNRKKEQQSKHSLPLQAIDLKPLSLSEAEAVKKLQDLVKDMAEDSRLETIKQLLKDKHDHELHLLYSRQQRRNAQIHADILRESLDSKVEATRLAPSILSGSSSELQREAISAVLQGVEEEIEAELQKLLKDSQKLANDELSALLDSQLAEVHETFKKLGISSALSLESLRLDREFQSRRAEIEKEASERLEALEKHKKQLSRLAREKKDDFERQLFAFRQQEEVENAKIILKEKQRKELEEKARKEGLSNKEIHRLIQQHQKEIHLLEENIENEKKRQRDALEKKLQMKMERKREMMKLPEDLKGIQTDTAQMMKKYRGGLHDQAVFDETLIEELMRRIKRIEKVIANIDDRQIKNVMNRVRAIKSSMK